MDEVALVNVATKTADDTDTDIVFYNGTLERPYDSALAETCKDRRRRQNVTLFLCTNGGDADVAYRIARLLQNKYKKFTVCIAGACKSAGTLLAIGAHEIAMSDEAELGPLDVQLGRKDEIWETDSGLTVLTAITTLEEKCFDLFEDCFLKLKSRSGGRITLKTATELATKLAIGTVSPIISQIDPMHVGEVSRAMNIGLEYGTRLGKKSGIVRTLDDGTDNTVTRLTNGYPSHGFVIDKNEAEELFKCVREINPNEQQLLDMLGQTAIHPKSSPIIGFISNEPAENRDEEDNQGNDQPAVGPGAAGVSETEDNNENSASPNTTMFRQTAKRRSSP